MLILYCSTNHIYQLFAASLFMSTKYKRCCNSNYSLISRLDPHTNRRGFIFIFVMLSHLVSCVFPYKKSKPSPPVDIVQIHIEYGYVVLFIKIKMTLWFLLSTLLENPTCSCNFFFENLSVHNNEGSSLLGPHNLLEVHQVSYLQKLKFINYK